MKRYHFLIWVMIFFCLKAYGQDQTNFTQFYLNPYLLNPSYAGIDGRSALSLTYRVQWATINGGPKIGNFSFHTPVSKRVSFGLSATNDVKGLLNSSGLLLSFGYNIPLSEESFFRFGISGGLSSNTVDLEKLSDLNDLAIVNLLENNNGLLGNTGISFHLKTFHAGFSLPVIFEPTYISQDAFNIAEIKPFETIIFHFSNRFYFNNNRNVFEPYAVYRMATNLPPQFELAAVLHLNHMVWLGGSFKEDFGISALGGIKLKNQLAIGASYSLSTAGANELNSPTYEVSLGMLLGKRRKETPMYSFVDTEKEKRKKATKKSASEMLAEQRRQEELARKKQQEELARKKQQEEAARKQQEELARKQQEEAARKQQEELARKQQEEAARKQQEVATNQQTPVKTTPVNANAQQEEAARKQREELARKQQEEAARKQQEELARKQQEEAARKQQEDLARKQQEETARKQQEELARKQREETARKQQEELPRKQQEELARKQQEETAGKQQEELARKQQEEAARKQQEDLARKQQEEAARKQQEDLARKQQEEAARKQQEELAKRQPEPQNTEEKDPVYNSTIRKDSIVIKHRPRFNHVDASLEVLQVEITEHTDEDELERIARLKLHSDDPDEHHEGGDHPNAERHEYATKGNHRQELDVSDYVITGVFKKEDNASHFAQGLQKLGFKAKYGHLTEKAVWYVYLVKTSDINVARTQRDTYRKMKIFRDAWLLTVQNKN